METYKSLSTSQWDDFIIYVMQVNASYPWLGVYLTLACLDILTGIGAAFVTKSVSSKVSSKGMTRKVLTLLVIATAGVLQRIAGVGDTLPLMSMAATMYSITEALSILENAARAGIPIPPFIVAALQRIKAADKEVLLNSPPKPQVNINHADKVEVDAHVDNNKPTMRSMRPDSSVVVVNTPPK